jgi:hypothetical protein
MSSPNEKDFDFGFTFHNESEIDDQVNSAAAAAAAAARLEAETATEKTYKEKLLAVEAIVVPFMKNLMKDPEKVMIRWPNRKDVVEKQLNKILAITNKN